MKKIVWGIAVTLLINGLMIPRCSAANESSGINTNATIGPQLHLKEKISLWNVGISSFVKKLSFSPNSRYLAIVDEPNISSATLIIWDLQEDREQTRIEDLPPYGDWPQVEPLWSGDGKSITFGNGGVGSPIRFWDPMTGSVERDLEINKPALFSRYNHDGNAFLVDTTPILPKSQNERTFRIYDTQNWAFKDYSVGDISTQTISWTIDDNVILAGYWAEYWGSTRPGTIDGVPVHDSDVVVRLISPSGKIPSHSEVIDHGVPWPNHPDMFMPSGFQASNSIYNYFSGEIAIGYDPIKILNCQNFETLFTYAPSSEAVQTGRAVGGFSGMTFSADGKYLFLLGASSNGDTASLILDSQTGAQIGAFPGGEMGLDASPDGKILAAGNGHSVNIFAIDSEN